MAEHTADEEIEAASETAEGEAKSGGGRKKLIIFGAGGLGLLIAIGAGLYFTGMLNRFVGHKEVVAQVAPPPKPAVFFDLPDFLVNLNGAGRKASFLKLSVSLELVKQEDVAPLQAVMPRIVDNFQIYLRELRVEDLKGSGGMYRLREELLTRVNAATAPIKVKDVLFREMLVQ